MEDENIRREAISSEELKRLFKQFRVGIPYDPLGESFVGKLLSDDLIRDIVRGVNSLAEGVDIVKNIDTYPDAKPGTMYAFEIDIDRLGEECRKVLMESDFLKPISKNLTRVLLIRSESTGVINAKLNVYEKCKDVVDKRDIFLQHIYEDFDEIAKLSACKKISSYEDFVQEMVDTFSTDNLRRVIDLAMNKVLTRANITEVCFEVVVRHDHSYVGTVESEPYICRYSGNVGGIKRVLTEDTLCNTAKLLGSEICKGILKHIKNVVQRKLSMEFMEIRYYISDAIFAEIEKTIKGVVIEIFRTLYGFLVTVTTFIITIFRPVDVNSKQWRRQVADEIYENISEKMGSLRDSVLENLKKICRKTREDFIFMASELKEFHKEIIPKDQKQLITEWLKKDIIDDKSKFKKDSPILKYIAGRKGDGHSVVKVFLRNHDEEAELLFEKACNDSDNLKFEYVNLADKSIKKKTEEIQLLERKAPVIDELTRIKMKKVIQEHGKKIFAKYSNVVGMCLSNIRCVDDYTLAAPCIVLYCLDKTLIPFGEEQLPNVLAGWPCDIREDFVMFGADCPNNCSLYNPNLPEPGCSIGRPSHSSSGSVGFLVEVKNPVRKLRCGFLTAAHVAIERFQELYKQNSLLSMNHLLSQQRHFIVHPSWEDNARINNTVGEVIESFCGQYANSGLDFALVKIDRSSDEEILPLPIARGADLNFQKEMKVTKIGRTTRETIGILTGDDLVCRIDESFMSPGYLMFFDCYSVIDADKENPFFRDGDSGSGVFLKDSDGSLKPLGIAFAYQFSKTAVCKINSIVDTLDLEIVKYVGNEQNRTSAQTGRVIYNRTSLPMDCN